MAFERDLHDHQLPIKSASILNPRVPVTLGGTSGLLALKAGSSNVRPHGITGAGTALTGEQAVVYEVGNIKKAVAAASLGAGVEVMVGSDNGALYPANASLFSASGHWAVGIAHSPAAAGEIFSVEIRPRKA